MESINIPIQPTRFSSASTLKAFLQQEVAVKISITLHSKPEISACGRRESVKLAKKRELLNLRLAKRQQPLILFLAQLPVMEKLFLLKLLSSNEKLMLKLLKWEESCHLF